MKLKTAILVVFLFLTGAFISIANPEAQVGVKPGEWIEYKVSYTGSPPPEHDVIWARMEVTGVEEQRVNATFVSQLANRTILTVNEDLDFATGRLIDMFIVPSGLNIGETFYAQNVGEITITDVQVRVAAGASRMTSHAEAEDTQWYWDRMTGVVVEARTASMTYTLDTFADKTSLWSPQILGLDQNVFYATISAIITAIVAAVIVQSVLKKRQKRVSF